MSARNGPSQAFVEIVQQRALADPGRPLYEFLANGEGEGSEALTYGELDRQGRAVAARLQEAGAVGRPVLLLCPPGLDFAAGFFGCLYAGAVAVPAPPPGSRRTLPRLLAILRDAAPAVALTTSAVLGRMRGWLAASPELQTLRWIVLDDRHTWPESAAQPVTPAGRDLAFLQYTSGSTALPKGVMVTHDNLLHNQILIRDACGHSERSVFVSWLPLYHDLGLIGNLLQAPFVGGFCVLMAPAAFLQRPARWLEAVSRHCATTSGGPNFAWDLCVHKISPEQRQGLDLSRWEIAFNGAEPVRAETLRRFAEAFASSGFRRGAFFPCYGLAEATLLVSAGRLSDASDASDGSVRSLAAPVSCGAPSGGEVLVVEPESAEACAGEAVGEIWVAGPSVAAGYWNRPEETQATFGARLRDGRGPYLRTGDLGFVRGGELFIAGRLKDLIILRGRNLYPQDLEATAMASHPAFTGGLAAAFAVGMEEGEERLVLVQEVGRRSAVDPELAAEAIRRAVAEEHEAHVEEVVLIAAGALPRTSSGKVQRGLCRALLLAGDLEVRGRSVLTAAGAEAETEVLSREDLLALPAAQRRAGLAGWLRRRVARAAGVAPARLSDDRPLSGLGLDSLGIAELKNALEEGLGIDLPLQALTAATLEEIAQAGLEGLSAGAPEPLVPGAAEESPLSPVQEAIWFLQRLAPEGAAYNVSFAARLPAAVDAGALGRALGGLISRHAALRTAFGEREGRPFQREGPAPAAVLAEADAGGWSAEDLLARVTDEANRPFDLTGGPPWRAAFYRGGAGGPVLLLTVHHLAIDGRSFWRLVEELGQRYQAELAGGSTTSSLPPPGARYRDFVAWQAARIAGPEGERLRRFQEHLHGVPALDLPTDRPRRDAAAPPGATVRFLIDHPLTRALRALAAAQRTTLYTVILAAFETLLHRWSGQEEFLLGTAVSGRGRREFAEAIGCFFHVAPLVARAGPGLAFTELLRRADAGLRGTLEHHLGIHRPGGSGPFRAVLIWQRPQWSGGASELVLHEAGWRLNVHGLDLELLPVERRFARQELELEVIDAGEVLAGALHYDADLFTTATASRMASHFERLLVEIAADPSAALAELRGMNAAEERLLREDLNRAGRSYARPVAVHDLFAWQAERRPGATAAIGPQGALTYRELEERSSRVAALIRTMSGRTVFDGMIGVLADPDPRVLTGLLGVLKAGAGFVPIDPRYPDERVAWILEDCACRVLVTQRRHLARAAGLARGAARLCHVLCLDGEEGDAGTAGAGGEPRDPRELRSVAYVVYTSGSTGRPKGVQVSHENLVPMLLWGCEALGLGEGSRVLQSLSFCFDFGLFEQLTTLAAGGTLVFPAAAGEPAAFAREIVRHGINTLHTTPAFARELAATGETLESLAVVHLGGEALSRDTVARLREVAPRAALFNGYGPTEATVNSSLYRIDGHAGGPGDGDWPVLPIGRRSADNALYVLDRAGRLVPFGARGELHVGGPGVARGYLNRPELTAGHFVPDPFGAVAGGRLYRTGDLVRYLPEGDVEFLGRIDQQVKVRGFRVEPGEIEAALCEHPAVREAAVAALPEASGSLQLVAYVVLDPASGAQRPASVLRTFLTRRLPPHMVPSVFQELAELPRTPNGKLDRRALPAPSLGEHAAGAEAPPRTAAEELVAGICADVLGLGGLGIHEDLFDLGCHSLLASKIVARVREALRVDLPLRSLFDAPTVAGLAAAARSAAAGEGLPPIVPVRRDADLPLSFPQERIWFLHKLEPASVAYNVPRALAVRGPLDAGLLARVFTEIVRRHEILRTTFEERGGRPVQIVHPPWRFTVPLIDLQQWQAPERDAGVARLIVEEGRAPFDLGRGPLIRVKVLRLAADEHVLVTTEHHLVHDGWTQGVLIRDFLALYAAFSRGAASGSSPLPELPVQYADFAVWQRQWLQGELLDRQIAFWRGTLAGAPPLSGVPADRPRTQRRSAEGGLITRPIPVGLANELRALSRRLGTTLFMTLLAVFDTLLWRSGAADDLPVGTVLANRRVQEIEGLLGMILNTLVLRVQLAGEPGIDELAQRVREVCLAAYEHQDAPIEKLVEVLQPVRSLSYTPLFQVLFSFLDTPMSDLVLPGMELRLLDSHNGSAKFDLNVTAIPHTEQRIGGSVNLAGSEIALMWEYSTDLYEPASIERLARHYLHLLAGTVADPRRRISELPLLDGAEQAQLLGARHPVWPAFPRERCVHELFAEQAARRPDAVALTSGGESVSYGALGRAAHRLARRLVRLAWGRTSASASASSAHPG